MRVTPPSPGMLTKLDESVGRVAAALQESGLLQNSIIVFTTDNGGPAASFDYNAASNWPLRGVSSEFVGAHQAVLSLCNYSHLLASKESSSVADQKV